MTWYWWIVAIAGWCATGVGVLAFGSYIEARLTGNAEKFDGSDDFALFLIGVILWPLPLLFVGALLVNRCNQMGLEDRKSDQGPETFRDTR